MASLVFYAWAMGPYVICLPTVILFNFLAGLAIQRLRSEVDGSIEQPMPSRWALGAAVSFNLAFLIYVKYSGFLIDIGRRFLPSLEGFEHSAYPLLNIPLLGVSYFTFSCISYLVDVYRGEVVANTNPLQLAVFVSVFPQLLAGPIVLYRQVHLQLTRREFDADRFDEGVGRFIVGLGKKVLIADVLAYPVDYVFSLPSTVLSPGFVWPAVLLFALQVYYDFSGYTDMAVGLGLIFGFRFPENFNYPYTSSSIATFWTRWHMSLTNWFRSYVFFPLVGSGTRAGVDWKILLVFGLIGIWHGASWTFLLFGLWNGLAFILEPRLLGPKERPWLGRAYLAFVLYVGLILFRSPDVADALDMLASGFRAPSGLDFPFSPHILLEPHIIVVLLLAIMGSTPIPARWGNRLLAKCGYFWGGALRALFLMTLFALSAVRVAASTHRSFLYFQF